MSEAKTHREKARETAELALEIAKLPDPLPPMVNLIAGGMYPFDLLDAAKLFDEPDRPGQHFGPQHPVAQLRNALALYESPPRPSADEELAERAAALLRCLERSDLDHPLDPEALEQMHLEPLRAALARRKKGKP